MANQNQKQTQKQNPDPKQNPNQNPDPNQNPPPENDFALKETSPNIGGRVLGSDSYDLVEEMGYLYVRVVKAKELPSKGSNNACDPFVEVRVGNPRCMTKHFESKSNPEWNQVFAFVAEQIQATQVEVLVKEKSMGKDDFIGKVVFELSEVPNRVPPESPLAPQWYGLENRSGNRGKGELMLAVWLGTQADEAFQDAFHSDAAGVSGDGISSIKSKVYQSPKLWYLRVHVIEAQDLKTSSKDKPSGLYVKALLGNMCLKSKRYENKGVKPIWNEPLMFVAAEPFEDVLVLSVEEIVGQNKEELVGKCRIPLQAVVKRSGCEKVTTRWVNLEKQVAVEEQKKEGNVVGKICVRISLDGGYHVLDELTQYSSDLRPTDRQLGKPSIGLLELGILSAQGLTPMKTKDGRESTNAYCVAKYGRKWIRTRTVTNCLNPKWNEQYYWEVFDPYTVMTLVVCNNCHLEGVNQSGGAKDTMIGKVRIRLSTLETGHLYTHSYPLLVLQPSGLKKMGEIQLAVRFSCSSKLNLMRTYVQPVLPAMHYLQPLTVFQQDILRQQATQVIAKRMSRAEPPLRQEVVEYVLDVGSYKWSMRKGKTNIGRMVAVLSSIVSVFRLFDKICTWEKPFWTVFIHLWCLLVAIKPKLIIFTVLLSFLMIGFLNYLKRPRNPPHMDARLSNADTANADELDEEFDTFPSSKAAEVVKMRYDRLRFIASRMQIVIGDLANQGERFHSLMIWRDPRATGLFITFCLVAAIVLFVVPIKLVFIVMAFYVLRHPRFREKQPSVPYNFFRRLAPRADSLL